MAISRNKLMPTFDAAQRDGTVSKQEFIDIVTTARSDGNIGGIDKAVIDRATGGVNLSSDARSYYEDLAATGILVNERFTEVIPAGSENKERNLLLARYLDRLGENEEA